MRHPPHESRPRMLLLQQPVQGELVTNDPGTTAPADERRSPLDAVHRAAGASFTDFAGWQMPVRYSSDLAEHHAVRTSSGIFDLSHMGEIVLIGPQAAAALDFALAGKLSAIEIGQAKYSLLLAEDGGIIDDLVVYRTGDDRYMVVANASNAARVRSSSRCRAPTPAPCCSRPPGSASTAPATTRRTSTRRSRR